METSKNTTMSTSDISMIELIEQAKKTFDSGDYKTSLYFLNLILLCPNLDLSTKIAVMMVNSSASFKLNNADSLIKISRKLFKYCKTSSFKQIPQEIMMMFVKMMVKSGQFCEKNDNLLYACWFYFSAKNLYEVNGKRNDDATYDLAKNGLSQIIKILSERVSEINY